MPLVFKDTLTEVNAKSAQQKFDHLSLFVCFAFI